MLVFLSEHASIQKQLDILKSCLIKGSPRLCTFASPLAFYPLSCLLPKSFLEDTYYSFYKYD